MSPLEIISRLCDVTENLSAIVKKQQTIIEQSKIEEAVRAELRQEVEETDREMVFSNITCGNTATPTTSRRQSSERRTPLTIGVSLLISGVSVAFAIFFGICSKQRNDKKDTQEETERRAENDTMVVVKLENIADDIKDIKRESRENREEMKQLRERVVIVEQSLKSYHKRLDGEQHSDR